MYLNPLKLDLSVVGGLDDEQFFHLCQQHPELRMERNKQGEIVIMSPTGGKTGNRNSRLNYLLWNWIETVGEGEAFDSSTGFRIGTGSIFSPDLAWLSADKWDSIPQNQREKFLPVTPDFLIELASESDRIAHLKGKMEEYIEAGVRLAWLIDPRDERCYLYRTGQDMEEVQGFDRKLSGEDVLPGFELDLKSLR